MTASTTTAILIWMWRK